VSGNVVAQVPGGAYPLAGVDVIATSGQFSRSGHTDGEGNFVLDRLTSGDWTISVAKRGYTTDAKVVSLSETDASISFELAVDEESARPIRPEPYARGK